MYFYPRPPRGGRPASRDVQTWYLVISIHALREEGDPDRYDASDDARKFLSTPSARRATQLTNGKRAAIPISIHALREEGDGLVVDFCVFGLAFLSTPSARRATGPVANKGLAVGNFYPRPPRGGRPATGVSGTKVLYFYPRPPRGGRPQDYGHHSRPGDISIHALREEGDLTLDPHLTGGVRFLSTPSARRATKHRSTAR